MITGGWFAGASSQLGGRQVVAWSVPVSQYFQTAPVEMRGIGVCACAAGRANTDMAISNAMEALVTAEWSVTDEDCVFIGLKGFCQVG